MVVQCIELVGIPGTESDLPLIRDLGSGVRSKERQGWTERTRNECEEILVSGLVVEIWQLLGRLFRNRTGIDITEMGNERWKRTLKLWKRTRLMHLPGG